MKKGARNATTSISNVQVGSSNTRRGQTMLPGMVKDLLQEVAEVVVEEGMQ